MSAVPFKLACQCGFMAATARDFVIHLAETSHGLDPDLAEAIRDGGEGFEEMVRGLEVIQGSTIGIPVPEDFTIAPLSDEDIDQDALEALRKFEALREFEAAEAARTGTTRMPPSRCVTCQRLNDAATSTDGSDVRPEAGDLTICAYCGTVMHYDHAMQLQLVTQDVLDAMPEEQRAWLAEKVVNRKKFLRRKP